MKYPLILIVGQAGSGKDTFAAMLANSLSTQTKSFALADPIKEFVSDLMGFTDDQLWGPSERRMEAIPSPRYGFLPTMGHRFAAEHPPLSAVDIERWLNNLPDMVSARHVLQTLGTDVGRRADPDIWVNAAMKKADRLLSETADYVIITDGRFRNEVLKVKERGGIVIKVQAPEHQQTGTSTHSSETEQTTIPDFWFDYIVTNDKNHGENALRHVSIRLSNWIRSNGPMRLATF